MSEVIKQTTPEETITISTYEDFVRCIQKSREQDQYVGNHQNKYQRAVDDLNVTNRPLYLQYLKKMQEQFNQGR